MRKIALVFIAFLFLLPLSPFSVKSEIGVEKRIAIKEGEKIYNLSFNLSPYIEGRAKEEGGFYPLFKKEVEKGYCDLYQCLNILSPKLFDFCQSFEKRYFQAPQNANFTTQTTYPFFSYQKDVEGRELDKTLLATQIFLILDGKEDCAEVKSKTLKAKITLDTLKEKTALLSKFSTSFYASNENRVHNITLASSLINGTLLQSGESFSFNKKVGKREKERGFQDAKVILEGKYVEGVGGGVCQVSTTLYNCALLGGMKIEKASPHSLLPAYVPPSQDAMVSDYSDLIFTNNTTGEVYIFSQVADKRITFYLFGKKDDIKRKTDSEIIKTIPFENTDEEGNILSSTEGYHLLSEGKEGVISQGYLITEKDGVTTKEKIRKDFYKKTNAVYGKAKATQ